MIKKTIIYCLFFSNILFVQKALAQKDTSFDKLLEQINLDDLFGNAQPKKSYFKISASYLSNYVYAGRNSDTSTYPYLTPTIEYNHKSGVYASVSSSFLAKNKIKNDVTNITVGYGFDINKTISTNIYANKSFYASSSKNSLSNVGFNAGATTTYSIYSSININAATDFLFGTQTDFTLQLSIDKTFYIGDSLKNNWSITPSISALAATTGFNQNGRAKDYGINILPPLSIIKISSPSSFQFMCYELSTSINYDAEKWGMYCTPTYAIPVNAINTTLSVYPPNRPQLTFNSIEKLSNTFYIDLGIYYKF